MPSSLQHIDTLSTVSSHCQSPQPCVCMLLALNPCMLHVAAVQQSGQVCNACCMCAEHGTGPPGLNVEPCSQAHHGDLRSVAAATFHHDRRRPRRPLRPDPAPACCCSHSAGAVLRGAATASKMEWLQIPCLLACQPSEATAPFCFCPPPPCLKSEPVQSMKSLLACTQRLSEGWPAAC